MNSFESRLSAALGQPQAGKVYLAAVSGGADSTAMLAALAELRKEAGFILHCVHVEHGIRSADESRGDARAVEALCEKLEVPCRLVSIAPGRIAAFACKGGPGIEGAARIFRRRAWSREARRTGAEYILTAHTRDDLLETILMRILRGSGPAGLAAMKRTRGRLLRPLLDLTRQDVLSYLEERGIPYRTDSTNADIRYLRNRIRIKLVPLLDDFFPSWRSSLLALAETQSMTAEFLASEVRRRLPWEREAGLPGKEALGKGLSPGKLLSLRLRESDFLNAPPILREEAVFAAVDMLAAMVNAAVPRRSAVRRAAGQGADSAEDLGPVRLRRQNGYIEMTPAVQTREERGFSLLIKEVGSYTLKGRVLGIEKSPGLCIQAGFSSSDKSPSTGDFVFSAAFYAAFYAKVPLVLRNHEKGDCLFKGGHKRRLSDILDRNARSEYTGIITAEDTEGPAAFICIGRRGDLMVISREDTKAGAVDSFFFKVLVKNQFC